MRLNIYCHEFAGKSVVRSSPNTTQQWLEQQRLLTCNLRQFLFESLDLDSQQRSPPPRPFGDFLQYLVESDPVSHLA